MYTPVHLAAYENKVDVLTVLLEHDPFLGYLISTYGVPLLCMAASSGHVGVARELLKHCPDAPYCNANGLTCLHVAVLNGQAVFVEYVLGSKQLQSLINTADSSGETALHLAQRNGLMLIAASLGDKEKITNNYPINEGPGITRSNSDSWNHSTGYNALHAAVRNGNVVMAKRLMEARPWLVRQENEDKRTPMNLAAHKNQIEVLRVLLQHDPSLGYFISTDGSPLLCIAATEGHVGVARELLRHCPDPPYCDATGSTCLHIAGSTGQGNFHLINLPNDRGETALRLAGRMLPAGDEQKTQTMMSIFDVLLCYRRDLLAEPFTSSSSGEHAVKAPYAGSKARSGSATVGS
ncbi:hypothetical protein SORBI_3005G083340 [Sorghum bicolor]|uniref:Uncharacterized protein n=1 Tax=Sorghum bicolor TaxID=4558 RepID=A0A1Z5RHA9_SORBI|nr:hypothetical protein SORBI_3005G083340 [Sorghum bicolor]